MILFAGSLQESGTADGVGAQARFDAPRSMAVAGDGSLYVADGNPVLRKVDLAGNVATMSFSDSTGRGPSEFFGPLNPIAVARNGTIVGVEVTLWTRALYTISPQGFRSVKNRYEWNGIGVMAADTLDDSVYFGDPTLVYRHAFNGDRQPVVSGFSRIGGLAVDSAGTLYIADSKECTVSAFTRDSQLRVVAGSRGDCRHQDGAASIARLQGPGGLATDNTGNVFISDDSGTIRKLTSDGQLTTVAGTAGKVGVQLGALPGVLGACRGIVWLNGALYALVGDAVIKITLPSS